MQSLQQLKSRKSCYFNADKRNMRLCGCKVDNLYKFLSNTFKVLFTFFAFNTIIENNIYTIFCENISDRYGLFQRFTAYELSEDCITNKSSYRQSCFHSKGREPDTCI